SVEPWLNRRAEAYPRSDSLLFRYSAGSRPIWDPAHTEHRPTRMPEDSTGTDPEPRIVWPPTHEPRRRRPRSNRIPGKGDREKRRCRERVRQPGEKRGGPPPVDVPRRFAAAARLRSGPSEKASRSAAGAKASVFGAPRPAAANWPAACALCRTLERRRRCEGSRRLGPVSLPRID